MKRDATILLITGVFALLIVLVAASTWVYLQRGYSLAVGIQGESPRHYHVDFPPTRRIAHVVLWASALIEIFLFTKGHKRAAAIGWSVFVAGVLVGIWDVVLYGSMGSPTGGSGLLLLLLLAVAAQFRNRLGLKSD